MTKRRSDSERRVRQNQRLGRTLKLLCLIQERGGRWNLDSLARELNCSKKTVQRDLLALEAAGIPYYDDDEACCYKVRRDFRLSFLDDASNRSTESGPSGFLRTKSEAFDL